MLLKNIDHYAINNVQVKTLIQMKQIFEKQELNEQFIGDEPQIFASDYNINQNFI